MALSASGAFAPATGTATLTATAIMTGTAADGVAPT